LVWVSLEWVAGRYCDVEEVITVSVVVEDGEKGFSCEGFGDGRRRSRENERVVI